MPDVLYVHETDAELAPGDLLLPAAATGHRSRHAGVPGYDPNLVYLSLATTETFGRHGRHRYAVEPLGPLGPDPEVEHLKRHYRAAAERGEPWHDDFGAEPGEAWTEEHLGSALDARTTSTARVLYRL